MKDLKFMLKFTRNTSKKPGNQNRSRSQHYSLRSHSVIKYVLSLLESFYSYVLVLIRELSAGNISKLYLQKVVSNLRLLVIS